MVYVYKMHEYFSTIIALLAHWSPQECLLLYGSKYFTMYMEVS